MKIPVGWPFGVESYDHVGIIQYPMPDQLNLGLSRLTNMQTISKNFKQLCIGICSINLIYCFRFFFDLSGCFSLIVSLCIAGNN
ncbi:MAG: hypothetical protein JNM21_01595 [Taibaiella sp.]|nr:hypothetical protein [Taibaiella sp.]